MDYSLLLGIHYLSRGNSENIRDKALSAFEPKADDLLRQPSTIRRRELKELIAAASPVPLDPDVENFPEEIPEEYI